jgi:hypothetical protein
VLDALFTHSESVAKAIAHAFKTAILMGVKDIISSQTPRPRAAVGHSPS